MSHLQPKQHYIDRYDRLTVERCRFKQRFFLKPVEGNSKEAQEKNRVLNWANYLKMFFLTGEEYVNKEETVRRWMEEDRKRDEMLANALPLAGITCLKCQEAMFLESTILHNKKSDAPEQPLFFFKCPDGCLPLRAFYQDGDEYRRSESSCQTCKATVRVNHKREGSVITTAYSCTNCGEEYSDTYDLNARREEAIDEHYEADRERFCLDEKRGQEYIESKRNFEGIRKFVEETKEQEKNKDLRKKMARIEKLTVDALEERLSAAVEKHGYGRLALGDPAMDRHVIVPFTARERKAGRIEYDSRNQLKKAIEKALAGTNWRLMSEGISHRLGVLSGRLRAYETEEDLLNLLKYD